MKAHLLQLFVKNSQSTEEIQQTIQLEQFIKDVNFDSQSKTGVLPESVSKKYSKDAITWYLQQSFLDQESPNTDESITPILLIPLFKIKDQQGQYVKYTTFEHCDINDVTTYYNNYYMGYRKVSRTVVKSIKFQVGDKKSVDLEERTLIHQSGFVILKDTNSDAAMLYYGLFINSYVFNSPNCELGLLFKKFVLKDKQNIEEATQRDMINPEDISVDIEFDPKELNILIDFLLPNKYNEIGYQDYNLFLNRSLGNCFNMKFIGHLKEDKVYFTVYKDTEIKEDEEIFMTIVKR